MNASLSILCDGIPYPEGPVFDRQGNLYVCTRRDGYIVRRSTDGVVSRFADTGGKPNGLATDDGACPRKYCAYLPYSACVASTLGLVARNCLSVTPFALPPSSFLRNKRLNADRTLSCTANFPSVRNACVLSGSPRPLSSTWLLSLERL